MQRVVQLTRVVLKIIIIKLLSHCPNQPLLFNIVQCTDHAIGESELDATVAYRCRGGEWVAGGLLLDAGLDFVDARSQQLRVQQQEQRRRDRHQRKQIRESGNEGHSVVCMFFGDF
jgi:hypothetical protein